MSYPFLHADRIKTPTLFLCGEDDFNVPLINSEQMYQALRSLGVPTQLVIYPGQHHGIRKPSYVRDRLERYVAWYDKYAKTAAPAAADAAAGALTVAASMTPAEWKRKAVHAGFGPRRAHAAVARLARRGGSALSRPSSSTSLVMPRDRPGDLPRPGCGAATPGSWPIRRWSSS